MSESSIKPYLIRALHDWCTDNGYSPHISVKVDENTVVPMGYVQDGQITLNISYLSTNQLLIGNEYIEFQARFGGATEDIFIPVAAVSAVFAREVNVGMPFEVTPSEPYAQTDEADTKTPSTQADSKPALKPVAGSGKKEQSDAAKAKEQDQGKDDDSDDSGRGGHLRLVK